jgi:serine protease Do
MAVDRMRDGRVFRFGEVLAGILLAVGWVGGCAGQGRTAPVSPREVDNLRTNLRQVVAQSRDRVFPALVNIHVVTVDYYGGKEHKNRAVGSGTIISKDGYVVTNQHVTNDGKKFKCTLANEEEIDAALIGEDPLTDLAVLKLTLAQRKSKEPLPVAAFGNSDELQIGDYVMAMGSPFALSRSVTLGIVSNTKRVFAGGMMGDDNEEMQLEGGQRTGLFTQWIQHDAAINPGNSGGPLVNLNGQIVGVNELGGGGGLGFAIPSNLARKVVEQLIARGEVLRSYIGVSLKPIEKTGLEKGVLINSVVKDEPAYKGGIRAGDVLLEVDGKPVTVRFAEEVPPLAKQIADLPIGSIVKVKYERDGKVVEGTVKTQKLQKDRGKEVAFRLWGLTGMEITDKIAFDHHLDSTDGVLISGVRDGGPGALAEPSLAGGDVIGSLDGQKVKNLDEFIKIYEKMTTSDKPSKSILVQFDRSGKNNVTLVKPKPNDEEDPPREVAKAWIGIDTQPVLKDLAEKLGNAKGLGFRVTRIYPKTMAASSDLKVGDIIVSLNGEDVRPRGMQDSGMLARTVRKLRIGEPAKLGVLRTGQSAQVNVELERTRITSEEALHDQNRDFELSCRELTFFDRDENRWSDDVQGVVVSQIEPAGWAGLGGIRSGDLIQRIGNYEIKDIAGYRKAMKAITKAQSDRVVFVILRDQRTHFQYVEPDWKPMSTEESAKQTAKANLTKIKE